MPDSSNSSGCYENHFGLIAQSSQTPCGDPKTGVQVCCRKEDSCLERSICHFTDLSLSNTTGFYTGGCTDPTFTDAACFGLCGEP